MHYTAALCTTTDGVAEEQLQGLGQRRAKSERDFYGTDIIIWRAHRAKQIKYDKKGTCRQEQNLKYSKTVKC